MICVDITDAPEIQYGTEVILLGNGHNDIRVEKLVSLYNGSSYELLCQVGRRAKRYYYEGGRLVTLLLYPEGILSPVTILIPN